MTFQKERKGGGPPLKLTCCYFQLDAFGSVFTLFGFGRFQTVALLIRFKLSGNRSFALVLVEWKKVVCSSKAKFNLP